jgi:hypothetical protein
LAFTVRILPLDGQWETLGVDQHEGITAEGIELTADEWGSAGASFVLAAQPGVQRPDLLPFTPIEFEDGGLLCWSGFVWERPSAEREHAVTCRGWPFHLDDDVFERVYVHTRVGDYRDQRTFPGAQLGFFHEGGEVNSDRGVAVIGWPNATVVPNSGSVGVTLDLGPDSTAKRIVLAWASSNNAANITAFARASAGSDPHGGSSDDAFSFAMNTGASGTTAGTFATARRYVHIFLFMTTGSTTGADVYLRINSLKVFRDTAYELGNVSILKADQVIKNVLPLAPLLDQSTAQIAAGAFSLPEYLTGGYISPRAAMEAVNAYENKQLKVDVLKRLLYRAKPSAPLFAVGADSGYALAEEGISGAEIYNQVRIEGTGPDGSPVSVLRTQTGTLVDRRSFDRTVTLTILQPITTTEANQIGDLWLAEHKNAPFAGTLTGSGAFVRKRQGGEAVLPAAILLHTGEQIELADRIDPDTGAQGRIGRIAAVRYWPKTKALEISLDERRDDVASFLSRFALLKEQPKLPRFLSRDGGVVGDPRTR